MHARLLQRLAERALTASPLRVVVIGTGTFGTMLLTQARRLNGLKVVAVADLSVERGRESLRRAGYGDGEVETTDDALDLLEHGTADVVVEATGSPTAGVEHALVAIDHGRHVVMVNVEADALAGPELARRARAADVVYSLAYGDQPALVCELVDWARACGFEPVCAGKGTKYLPAYHAVTPDSVWEQYGLDAGQVERGGFSAHMFTSFIDGTKSAIEMAAVCNATELRPQAEGLRFPPAGVGDLARVCVPESDGGSLSRGGTVEVVSSLERDGSCVPRDLRWGVFVTFAAPTAQVAEWFHVYGLTVDRSRRHAALYRPFHLVGLEATISVLSAGLLGEPTGCPRVYVADVAAAAKRDLAAGERLDGEGGFTVHGALVAADTSSDLGLLPIGLTSEARLRRAVRRGELIRLADTDGVPESTALELRAAMRRAPY